MEVQVTKITMQLLRRHAACGVDAPVSYFFLNVMYALELRITTPYGTILTHSSLRLRV